MSGGPFSRGGRRRLSMGLATVFGLAKRGFFIPYRYAGQVPGPGRRSPYTGLEALFAAREDAFRAVLADIDGYGDALRALGGEPPVPRWQQDWFPRLDGAAAYAMIRARAPARIVEVGSGHSTRFFARAAADGGTATRISAIDPAPRADIGALGVEIVAKTVQEAGLTPFTAVSAGDVLSIDSSHVLMPGTDVDFLLNVVLPALPAGVLVHVHDILLPDDYPAEWLWRGYNEQQGIGALVQGGGFAVLWSSRYVATRMADAVEHSAIADLPLGAGAFESSLWLEKR